MRSEDKSWIPPSEDPSPRQMMKMIGMMVSYCVKLAMSKHYYTFDGEIKRQSKGGATGNTLTMELSRMFGLWWDKMYLKMLKDLQVQMMTYWRYVDDNGNVMRSINPGVRLAGVGPNTSPLLEALPFFPASPWMELKPELVEEDKLRSEDERTAAFLCEVANSIHPSITVKSDYPSKNTDQKMPLLDLKLWVEDNRI